ncbi:MAG: murein biosynthesis integral membrane protein MurJ [Anaerolineae bacterium]
MAKEETHEGPGLARAAGIIALGNVASRILGLVRETVIAHLFGATGLVSAYRVASIVPTMLYDLLIGGMVSSALVPVFSEYASSERREELWRIASLMLSLTAVVLAGVAFLLEIFTPQVAWLLGGGFEAEHPELLAETARLMRLTVPAVIFLGLSGIITGLLYALKRFTYPAFTVAVFNAGIVAFSVLLAGQLEIASVALGLLAGAALQVAIQLVGLRDMRFTFSLDIFHPGLGRIFALYLPIALGLVISQVQVALDRNLASRTGPQSIAWMQNATTLIQFPHGLVAVAISLAVLPSLSGFSVRANWEGYGQTLGAGLRMVLVLIFPAAVGLFILARPIVALIFQHGEFKAYDTAQTALALRYYLPGLLFASIDWPLNYAFYARQNTWTPALVGVLSVGIYTAVAFALIRPLGMVGLVIADSAKHTGHALTMLFLTWRWMGLPGGKKLAETTFKALLASAAMGGAVWVLAGSVESFFNAESFLRWLAVVGAAGGAGFAFYGAFISLLGVEEMAALMKRIGRFLKWTGKSS